MLEGDLLLTTAECEGLTRRLLRLLQKNQVSLRVSIAPKPLQPPAPAPPRPERSGNRDRSVLEIRRDSGQSQAQSARSFRQEARSLRTEASSLAEGALQTAHGFRSSEPRAARANAGAGFARAGETRPSPGSPSPTPRVSLRQRSVKRQPADDAEALRASTTCASSGSQASLAGAGEASLVREPSPHRNPPEVTRANLEVVEVRSQEEQDAAWALHMSKDTFYDEKKHVKLRVFCGWLDHIHCRTWLLMEPKAAALRGEEAPPAAKHTLPAGFKPGAALRRRRGSVKKQATEAEEELPSLDACNGVYGTYVAAVTVRFNRYAGSVRYGGYWAQILNMSSRDERVGHGTILAAGLEVILRREEVDVVVLYPADNGGAPAFWSSIGYRSHQHSLLPPDELISCEVGGPLVPEFDPGCNEPLPRWEKRIGPPAAHAAAAKAPRPQRRASAGGDPRGTDLRCKAWGLVLWEATEELLERRARSKAETCERWLSVRGARRSSRQFAVDCGEG